MSDLLIGKNALITGAGRNIGRSVAIEMAKEGANVYFTEIDRERRRRVESELTEYEVSSRGFDADITRTTDTDELCSWLSNAGITIDVLVNNVGKDCERNASDSSFVKRMLSRLESRTKPRRRQQIWKATYETNVLGPMYLTDRISEMMLEAGQGSIIFVTSIHQWTIRGDAAYSSSKAALGMVVKELALSLAPHGIRVNGIAPGYIEEDGEGRPLAHRYTPLHQSSINPCYIARAAVYLSSEYFSKFTTGEILKIDAGLSLHNYVAELP